MAHAPSFQFAQPGQTVGPLPPNPVDRGRLLLSRTRELIALRGQVRQLENECRVIIQSLCDEQA